MDSPGAAQIPFINTVFTAIKWWELVPDQTHAVVTGGYGPTPQETATCITIRIAVRVGYRWNCLPNLLPESHHIDRDNESVFWFDNGTMV